MPSSQTTPSKQCDACPHEEHEFMWCQTDDCPCSKRYPAFCDNTLSMALKVESAFIVKGGKVFKQKKSKKKRKKK